MFYWFHSIILRIILIKWLQTVGFKMTVVENLEMSLPVFGG